jgi:hypothetical protein
LRPQLQGAAAPGEAIAGASATGDAPMNEWRCDEDDAR